MNSKSKKILALLAVAVLALAGVAFAAITDGVLSTSGASVATTLGSGFLISELPAVPGVRSNDAKLGFNVPGNVTIEGDTVFTTIATITSNNPTYRGIGLGAYASFGTILTTANTNPTTSTLMRYDWVPTWTYVREGNPTNVAGIGGGTDRGTGLAGAVNIADGATFIIKPATDSGPIYRRLGNVNANVSAGSSGAVDGDPATTVPNGDVLRLYGGTTEIYAPNNNAPTIATGWNNYDGGTALIKGRLNVKHSNALGYGHVTAFADTVLGFDYNDEISLGGTPFLSGPNLGQLIPGTTTVRQELWVLRANNSSTTGTASQDLTYDTPASGTTRRGAPVEFNVTRATDEKLTTFSAMSGIRENRSLSTHISNTVTYGTDGGHIANRYAPVEMVAGAPTNLNAIQIVKTGEGKMAVSNRGSRHTGGTWVKEGTLELLNVGESGNRYVGELGQTWRGTVNEQQNPQRNYYYGDTGEFNAFALNNALRIDEGAAVILNRDQFFGNFDGEGTFEARSWARSGATQYPQITVLLDRMSTNASTAWQKDSTFTGLMKGEFNFVLRGGTAKEGLYLINADNTKLILAGEDNQITYGDTTIADGTLSINSIGQLGPGDIRVGLATDDTTRGIVRTDAVPTLHGWGNFTVPQKVTTAIDTAEVANAGQASRASWVGPTALGTFANNGPRMRRVIPNLAADRGYTMSLTNVDLSRSTPDILDNGVGYQQAIHFSINNQFGGASTPYAGLIAAGGGTENYLDGVSLANPVHTERTWSGTVAFTDEYTFPADATAAQPFSAAVMNGVWHLEKTPVAGYSKVYVSPGATLSFGSEARDFLGTAAAGNTTRNPGMDLMLAANSRVRVKVTADDFKSSQAQATVDTAILKMSHIDYSFANSTKSNVTGTKDVGFQMGEAYKDQELVLELDLSGLSNNTIPAGTWINILTSNTTVDMQALNYTPEGGSRYAKVKFASTGTQDFNLSDAVAYVDVDSHSILFYAEKAIQPTDPTNPVDPTETTQQFIDKMSAEEKAKLVDGINFITSGGLVITDLSWTSATQSITAYLLDVADDGTVTVLDTFNGQEIELGLYAQDGTTPLATGKATVTDGKVTITFTDLDDLEDGTYILKGTAEDGSEVTITLKVESGVIDPDTSSGSSGCDAGFGAFALLALGAAVVLRKKD